MNRYPLLLVISSALCMWSNAYATDSATARSPVAATASTQQALEKEAKVTRKHARELALDRVPEGSIKREYLERKDGKLVWMLDVKRPDRTDVVRVTVNAATGEVVSRLEKRGA